MDLAHDKQGSCCCYPGGSRKIGTFFLNTMYSKNTPLHVAPAKAKCDRRTDGLNDPTHIPGNNSRIEARGWDYSVWRTDRQTDTWTKCTRSKTERRTDGKSCYAYMYVMSVSELVRLVAKTSHATIFQSYMWRHIDMQGGLKKLYLRSGSQRHRHFVGFFNVPVLHLQGTNLFIRLFWKTARF